MYSEIPEKMAPWVKAGQAVSLEVDAFPGRPLTGTLTRLSPAVNPSTRAFPFEAQVPNPAGALKPGTFARVRIESSKVDDVLTVPLEAVQYRYGTNRVFVLEGGKQIGRAHV